MTFNLLQNTFLKMFVVRTKESYSYLLNDSVFLHIFFLFFFTFLLI